MKIAVGCDEAAFDLKMIIIEHLKEQGYEVDDFGAKRGSCLISRRRL